MLRTRIIPCLLLDEGKLVKTVQFKNPRYVGDPANAVKIFNDAEADEIVLLDISRNGRPPDFKLLEKIADSCFSPIAYGGGIHNVDDAVRIIMSGFEKIIVNSGIFRDENIIEKLSHRLGSCSVVASLDVVSMSANGKDVKQVAEEVSRRGAGEIFLTSIEREGTWQGYDTELIQYVSESVSIPVVANGGAGHILDFRRAKDAGASAVAAGSMFVYRDKNGSVLINYPSREKFKNVLKKNYERMFGLSL